MGKIYNVITGTYGFAVLSQLARQSVLISLIFFGNFELIGGILPPALESALGCTIADTCGRFAACWLSYFLQSHCLGTAVARQSSNNAGLPLARHWRWAFEAAVATAPLIDLSKVSNDGPAWTSTRARGHCPKSTTPRLPPTSRQVLIMTTTCRRLPRT